MIKRRSDGILDWIAEISFQRMIFHPVTLMVAATIAVAVGGNMAWQEYRPQIAQGELFDVSLNRIRTPERPGWVPADWEKDAFEQAELGEASLLDAGVAEKVATTFSLQPYVKRVRRVEKHRHGLDVKLEFRRPVGLVEMGRRGLVPVDDEGVILDGSLFQPEQVDDFWRISVPLPIGQPAITGQRWPDPRVVGAAKIAGAWDSRWRQLDLLRVVNRSPANSAASALLPFEIWTRNQLRIVWGNPPGEETEGEATANEKIDALQAFLSDAGQIQSIGEQHGIDVRSGQIKTVPLAQAERSFDFLNPTYQR